MTDVDYYTNILDYLGDRDLVLYTFVPQKVAGMTTDAVYSPNPDNSITMCYNGGASYTHSLWDFDSDHCIVDHWWGSSLYLIEQREISSDRRLIYFNLIRRVYGPFAWFLSGHRLSKRRFSYGNYAYMKIIKGQQTDMSVYHSFARISSHSSVEVSDSCLQTIAIRVAAAKEPQISDIERILRASDHPEAPFAASVLFDIIKNSPTFLKDIQAGSKTSQCVKEPEMYQTLGPLVTEDAKSSCRKITCPLLNSGVHPGRSYNNDEACIAGRQAAVKNPVTKYPPFFYQCISEYLERLIPADKVHSLAPTDFDTQYKQFDRPSQRGILNSLKHIFYYDSIWKVKAFQKAEIYAKVTDPRNISTLPMDHNFRLGQFTTVLSKEIFKPQPWYAFGKHPTEITSRLQETVRDQTKVYPTDISRCDGSTGYIHYCLTAATYMRAFGAEYHSELTKLMQKEAFAQGVTSFGVKYDVDYNTLTGSSMTSIRNSNINAFINYVALRNSLSPDEAYQQLGLFGGDDGIAINIDPGVLTKTFAKMGILIKLESVNKGQPVPFLGRIYLDPWTTNESIVDIKRQLRRLHLTTSPESVPTHVIMHRRAAGYRITDPDTPFIKEWCSWVERVYPFPTPKELERSKAFERNDTPYWSKFERPYPRITSEDLAIGVALKELDVTVDKYDRYKNDLSKADEQLSTMDNFFGASIAVDIPATINGNVVLPLKPRPVHQQQVKDNANIKTKASVLPKTRSKPNPFNPAPKPTTSRAKLVKHVVIRKCRFAELEQPCPYGKACLFQH
jgi:hypothetical protein